MPVRVLVEDPDAWYADLTITQRAAVAAAERAQRLGVTIRIDRGDGVMVAVADRAIPAMFTIEESTDSFGDTFTFQLSGHQYSPFARASLRRRLAVSADLVYGSPANEYRKRVFDGFIVDHTFSGQPPVATITCADAAGLYAERRLKDYVIPANSGRQRMDIVTEVLTLAGIPFSIPDGGGGVINKPYAIGDEAVCSWVRNFLRVIGCEVGFIANVFQVVRWTPDLPPVLTLSPRNIIPPYDLKCPTTLDANVIGVVAVSVTHTDELTGREGITTLSETRAPYAPATAEFQIVAGAPAATGATSSEETQIIARTRTSTSYLGNLEVRYEQTDETMYAVAAALTEIRATGDETYEQRYRDSVYIFPDGSTRRELREHLQITRKTIRTKELDGEKRVIRTRETRFGFRNFRRRLFDVLLSLGELYDHPPEEWTAVTDDGEGSAYGSERIGAQPFWTDVYTGQIPDEIVTTDINIAADGTIESEVTTEQFYDIGPPLTRRDGAHGYGLDTSNRKYASHESDAGEVPTPGIYNGRKVATKSYRTLSEDRYLVTESVRVGSGIPTVTTSEVSGSIPRPEHAEPTTSSQEIRSIVKDGERIAYAGEEIEATEHNEFIQNQAEADFFCRYVAWEKSAIVGTFAMPVESQVHKWKSLIVNVPQSAISNELMFVRAVRRDAVTFSQSVTLARYSPLLS